MDPSQYSQLFQFFLPEIILLVGALVVVTMDLTFGKIVSLPARQTLAALGGALAVLCAGAAVVMANAPLAGPVFGGAFRVDALALAARAGVLLLTLLALGALTGARPQRHPAEFVAIVLMAACGLTLMGAAANLLAAFLSLELASLSLYILAGIEKQTPESSEAGLKYFFAGAVSSAFLLFGFSLLYGISGSLGVPDIAAALSQNPPAPLATVALVMVLVAFGFKAAAAPFHLWAPDAYQGAPAPAAALIASASKLAGFVFFARLLWPDFTAPAPGGAAWLPAAALLSGASLLLGNIAALAQRNVRRILAYSAIGHAGVLLLAVSILGSAGAAPLYYYALTYGIATAGAFGVLAALERKGAPAQNLRDLDGLRRRSPFLAACLFVFILSLAGIPPLAGFFGKFYVFAAALSVDALAAPAGRLSLLAIAMSAVALYYYLLILKHAVVTLPAAGNDAPVRVPFLVRLSLAIVVLLLVALGLWPQPLLDFLA
ncbi:MAG: NADH-quinone oxidoreductase subunit N [Opitutaceae bacterium]|jgi:NADH-quinone oxidoreductase subunit N|nr:NADH-quinone oxidoreductase subunit N [Opitutaceae bacterium]